MIEENLSFGAQKKSYLRDLHLRQSFKYKKMFTQVHYINGANVGMHITEKYS